MKAKRIIGNLLWAFVLVSVGFAIGQEVQRRRQSARPRAAQNQAAETATVDGQAAAADAPASAPGAGEGDKVVVYYLHATYRCLTCNLVESTAKDLVATNFADAMKAGRLEWRTANFQEDAELADRYNVAGNMIVVARFRDGREVAHRRLDRVMELIRSQDEFADYVLGGVQEILGGGS